MKDPYTFAQVEDGKIVNQTDVSSIEEAEEIHEMLKVFDWDKAMEIIAERKPASASAALVDDKGAYGQFIFEGGKVVSDYCPPSSKSAVPSLILFDEGMENEETVECWRAVA